MDDKNSNELIDFSNQPLGIMAQEGSKIEENLNREFAENEAKRAENNMKSDLELGNPFADVNISPSTTPEINASSGNEKNNGDLDNGMAVLNQNPSETPSISNEVFEEKINLLSDMPEEVRKEELMKSITNGGSDEKNDEALAEGQVPSWGVFVFLLLVGLVAGAFILFKTGKIDELFKNEEDVGEVVSDNSNSDKVLETEEGEQQPVIEVEKVRNYHVKQTEYVANKDTLSITFTGTIDIENKIGIFISTTSYNGLTSHNIDEYCDYDSGYCYIQDFEDKSKWTKEKFEVELLTLEEKLSYIQSLGTSTEVSSGNYKIEIPAKEAISLAFDKDSIDTSKFNINENITVEYSINDGYLVKVKFDFSKISTEVDKYIIYMEFSDFNKSTEKLEIPENIINSAK